MSMVSGLRVMTELSYLVASSTINRFGTKKDLHLVHGIHVVGCRVTIKLLPLVSTCSPWKSLWSSPPLLDSSLSDALHDSEMESDDSKLIIGHTLIKDYDCV